MKKINILLLIVLVGLSFISCSTVRSNAIGLYPIRQIEIDDLPADYYQFIGSIKSEVKVDLSDPEELDINRYIGFDLFEGGNITLAPLGVNLDDPIMVGLRNGAAMLVDEADRVNASFLAYPKYSIRYDHEIATITFRAEAVRVRNPKL